MANKYDVRNPVGMSLGNITKYRAEKAIFYGIANRSKDINDKAIYTDFNSIIEFEHGYKEHHKHNSKQIMNCWVCGTKVSMGSKSQRPYCDICDFDRTKKIKEDSKIYSILRSEMMLERAFKTLEQQEKFVDIEKYKEAGQVLESYIIDNYSKFDSSHEMVAAMELLRNKVHIKIQPTINGRKADFMLKDDKVVLEVDGYFHQHTQVQDYNFDNIVREELGLEWEVVRIPTKYIEKNVTALYEAIMELKAYKQKLRKSNNGVLPDYYSEREAKALKGLLT